MHHDVLVLPQPSQEKTTDLRIDFDQEDSHAVRKRPSAYTATSPTTAATPSPPKTAYAGVLGRCVCVSVATGIGTSTDEEPENVIPQTPRFLPPGDIKLLWEATRAEKPLISAT